MATKSGNKSKQYLQAKKQQKKGSTVKRSSAKRGSKKQREKRILAGVLSVIALLTVIIGILFACNCFVLCHLFFLRLIILFYGIALLS